MREPLYPNVRVKLVGSDGNAFAIIGKVCRALKDGKVPIEKIEEYRTEAMSGDYDNVLQTTLKWVEAS